MSVNWVPADFYVGTTRLARGSDGSRTLRFLSAVAAHDNFSIRGARSPVSMLHADDVAVGDLYDEL